MIVDFRYNKKETKKLVSSFGNEPVSKVRIDWLLDNNKICGLVKERWLGDNYLYLLGKRGEDYRLITISRHQVAIYTIEDIDAFIEMSNCNLLELQEDDDIKEENIISTLKHIEDFPSTGLIVIDEDRIFVLDCIGVEDEITE